MTWQLWNKQIYVYAAAFFSSEVGFFSVGFFSAAGFLVPAAFSHHRLLQLLIANSLLFFVSQHRLLALNPLLI